MWVNIQNIMLGLGMVASKGTTEFDTPCAAWILPVKCVGYTESGSVCCCSHCKCMCVFGGLVGVCMLRHGAVKGNNQSDTLLVGYELVAG
jgi:hypothetical protein